MPNFAVLMMRMHKIC